MTSNQFLFFFFFLQRISPGQECVWRAILSPSPTSPSRKWGLKNDNVLHLEGPSLPSPVAHNVLNSLDVFSKVFLSLAALCQTCFAFKTSGKNFCKIFPDWLLPVCCHKIAEVFNPVSLDWTGGNCV